MIYLNDDEVKAKCFPDGTPFLMFEEVPFAEGRVDNPEFDITWKFDNMGELFIVQCLVDWLNSHDQYVRDLYMPYIPNARMDRVKTDADVFTLKTFAKLINDMKFDHVYVRNAHSNVSLALIDNIVDAGCELDINEIMLSLLKQPDVKSGDLMIFFPDEGATKRYSDYNTVKRFPIVTGVKKRNWVDGKILSLEVFGDKANVKDKTVLIVDDISSYGNSFYYSALKLKEMGASKIFLYVTHCENCIDWKKLRDAGIEHVYTTDSIYRMPYNSDLNKEQNDFITLVYES